MTAADEYVSDEFFKLREINRGLARDNDRKSKTIKRLEAEVAKAEHAARDIERWRDHWKDRALAAEAAVHSLGVRDA